MFLNLLLFWNPNFGLESCFSILLAINFLTQICSWIVISFASQNVKCCRWFLLPRFVLWTFIIAHNPFYDPCLTLLRLEEKERAPFLNFFFLFRRYFQPYKTWFLGINCKAMKVLKLKDLHWQLLFINLNLLRFSSLLSQFVFSLYFPPFGSWFNILYYYGLKKIYNML